VPFAIEDTYLSRLSEAVLGPNENALTIPCIPGHENYLRELGMLSTSNKLIELPYNPPSRKDVGYPHAEIFSLASKRGLADYSGSCVVSWFPSPAVRASAEHLGCFTPQDSNAYFTNNKVYLRQEAERFGIRMCDGLVVAGEGDAAKAAKQFAGASRVWIKNDIGSGGDGVIALEAPITEERLRECIARQYRLAEEAFTINKFTDYSLEQYWGSKNPESPPVGTPRIVVEADVSAHGTAIANCSNLMLIRKDGSYSVERYFRQRVSSEGAYQGSQPYLELDSKTRAELDFAMKPLADFCAAHRLFGIVGVDFMLVRTPEGALEARIIELNGRPPVSASAVMAAEKLGAPAWINCNIWGPHELNSIEDFERMMTLGGTNHARASLKEGLIFPLAFRALYSMNERGERALFHPSCSARVLICGESMEGCEELLQRLQREKGVTLQPPKQ
jgi:hypothetical protein